MINCMVLFCYAYKEKFPYDEAEVALKENIL